ncbi:MAG: TIGR02117 family protein [Calothrix sp. C42_A2020_038]|nr:TIGR02117 family protein [Calothrix sp. C42_A2020_038]
MNFKGRLKKKCNLFWMTFLSALMIIFIGILTPSKWFYDSSQPCDVNIYVINGGVHSDILLPVKTSKHDWNDFIPLEQIGTDINQQYKYLSFGWGEHDFYINTPTVADIKIHTVIKALFYPNNSSVMHVRGFNNLPDQRYVDIKCVGISHENYLRLAEFIQKSFQTDSTGRVIRLANGYNPYGGFYGANGSYSILRNCNHWTVDALRLANVNTPVWSGLSTPIMWHLKNNCTCRSNSQVF